MNEAVRLVLGVSAAFAASSLAQGAIIISSFGTGAPAASVGGFAMTPAISDPAPIFADVVSAPLAFGSSSVLFSSPLSHRRIGSGWGSWSHGYVGDVYYSNGASSLTLTFNHFSGANLKAFYFYVEPNGFGLHDFTISGTGTGGATASTAATIEGLSSAQGFGFATTSGTASLTSVTISLTSGSSGFLDFAVGEFAWSGLPPAPGGLAAFAAAALCGRRRRR